MAVRILLADDHGVWVWPEPMTTADPEVVRCELSVGRATSRLSPATIVDLLIALRR